MRTTIILALAFLATSAAAEPKKAAPPPVPVEQPKKPNLDGINCRTPEARAKFAENCVNYLAPGKQFVPVEPKKDSPEERKKKGLD